MKGLLPSIRELFFGPVDPRPKCARSGCYSKADPRCQGGNCSGCCQAVNGCWRWCLGEHKSANA